jgi:alginate O-acetyltransferase complex protein AlgI
LQFNSLAYFVFLVFAIVTSAHLKHRLQNAWLVILSYAFYSFWDWRFCSLMFLATLAGYYPALKIQAAIEQDQPIVAKRWLKVAVIASLSLLGLFKYTDFCITSAKTVLDSVGLKTDLRTINILLPAGISFYLFHTISYVVDVYRKEVRATKDFIEIALFLSFFPQLIAGPIARSASLLPQCQNPRVVTAENIRKGLFLIMIGLFRKVAIADTAGALADQCFAAPDQQNTWMLLQGALWYAIQIYCDFSGYSDLARGSGQLFGFNLIKNFDHPYLATNISEFWKKWHISLSSWLRDYLYIPLGGNRRGASRTYFNLMVTMLLGGLWHGASWNFILWGGLHGLFLIVHQLFRRSSLKIPDNLLVQVAGSALTLLCVGLAWIPFRAVSFDTTMQFYSGLLSFDLKPLPYLIPSIFLIGLVFLVDLPQVRKSNEYQVMEWKVIPRVAYYALLIFLLVLSGDLSGASFIYFQF